MKAIVQRAYGSADVFELAEAPKPTPKDDEVVVRVKAAAIHAGDVFAMRGDPPMVRLYAGIPRPRNYIPGQDAAGTVDAVGPSVTRLKPGDEVFGATGHACAEYTCAAEDHFVPVPSDLTCEQAAAVPTSGLAALQGIRDAGRVVAGQRVLVNGASGGVGTFAVQIAKALGAEVTGVCSSGNVDLVRSLGADHVIDYGTEDFTLGGATYDLIFDNVANRPFSDCRRALAPGGRYLPNSGNRGLGFVVVAFLRSLVVRQQARPFISSPGLPDLRALAKMLADRSIRPVVDRTYALEDTPEAFAYLDAGHARGKVVITV
jgi:NADPH:quinone reductase-like Zn-dependent oxidoreductase